MSGEGRETLEIVIFALFGGSASIHIDRILDISPPWNIIIAAITTVLLFIAILLFKYAINKYTNVNDGIKESSMMVAGVLIGIFVSKSIDIISNQPLALSIILFVFAFIWLFTTVYLFLKCSNPEWLANIQRRFQKF